MWEAFFGFKKTPFSDRPDPKQLFASQAWEQVQARLQSTLTKCRVPGSNNPLPRGRTRWDRFCTPQGSPAQTPVPHTGALPMADKGGAVSDCRGVLFLAESVMRLLWTSRQTCRWRN